MYDLPQHLLTLIFDYLPLADRCRAGSVCRSWANIMNQCHVSDVMVLNIFEAGVWEEELNKELRDKFNQWFCFKTGSSFLAGLAHVMNCCVVKMWFRSGVFVGNVLSLIEESGLRYKSLDLFPYRNDFDLMGAMKSASFFNSLTIRPHGKELFSCGITLEHLPTGCQHLRNLGLESVDLVSGFKLPSKLVELEFSAPRNKDSQLTNMITGLTCISQTLKHLQLAHANFESMDLFNDFLSTMARLPELWMVGFKFCKFPTTFEPAAALIATLENISLNSKQTDACSDDRSAIKPCFAGLRAIKFDLCYGQVTDLLDFLIEHSPALRVVCFESILTATAGLPNLYASFKKLVRRKILLKFSVLQRCTGDGADLSADQIEPSIEIAEVLCRLDLAFVESAHNVNILFNSNIHYNCLTEFRAIRCAGLTDLSMRTLATQCPQMAKVTISGCSGFTQVGLWYFVANESARVSSHLKLTISSCDLSLPAFYFGALLALGNEDASELVRLNGLRLPGSNSVFIDESIIDVCSEESVGEPENRGDNSIQNDPNNSSVGNNLDQDLFIQPGFYQPVLVQPPGSDSNLDPVLDERLVKLSSLSQRLAEVHSDLNLAKEIALTNDNNMQHQQRVSDGEGCSGACETGLTARDDGGVDETADSDQPCVVWQGRKFTGADVCIIDFSGIKSFIDGREGSEGGNNLKRYRCQMDHKNFNPVKSDGEKVDNWRLVVWDPLIRGRTLVIQDYPVNVINSIVGFVVGDDVKLE